MCAVASYFDWWQNKMMTEFSISHDRRSDLIFVTPSGYATEVEMKISVTDWNADQKKRDWSTPPKYVKNFYYAVPETLENQIPAWIPEYAGIIVVRDGGLGWDRCDIVRQAKAQKCEKLPAGHLKQMVENCYYRYWRQQIDSLRRRHYEERTKEIE